MTKKFYFTKLQQYSFSLKNFEIVATTCILHHCSILTKIIYIQEPPMSYSLLMY